MKKGTVIMIAIIAVFVLLFSWGVLKYNGFVDKQEAVNTAWSQVENQYQRRLDLIPNLVETVKGYAAHESETLTAVIEARSKATAANINADNLTEENLAKFQQ